MAEPTRELPKNFTAEHLFACFRDKDGAANLDVSGLQGSWCLLKTLAKIDPVCVHKGWDKSLWLVIDTAKHSVDLSPRAKKIQNWLVKHPSTEAVLLNTDFSEDSMVQNTNHPFDRMLSKYKEKVGGEYIGFGVFAAIVDLFPNLVKRMSKGGDMQAYTHMLLGSLEKFAAFAERTFGMKPLGYVSNTVSAQPGQPQRVPALAASK